MQQGIAVTDALLVGASVEPPALFVLDRPTGRRLWQVKLDAAATTAPVVDKDTVFLGTAARLEVRSLSDGSPRADFPREEQPVASDLVVSRQVVAYVSQRGQLVVISRADPTAMRKLPGAVPAVAPVLSRGTLLYATKDALMALPLDEENPEPKSWAEIGWLGKPTSPMILAGSNVYLGMAGWGLARFGAGR